VRGHVIKPKEVGLYAASICPGSNPTKQLTIIGPAGIEYDRESGAYTVTLKTQGMENLFFSNDEPKFLDLWVQTKQVEKIKYGAEAQPDERVNTKHLHLSARLPMDYYPDPRVVIEDQTDQQKFDREIAEKAKRIEEERLVQVAAQLARKEERARKREEMLAAKMNADDGDEDDMSGSDKGSKSGSGHTPQGSSNKHRTNSHDSGSQDNSEQYDDDDLGEEQDEEDYDGGVGDLPTAPEMQQELIIAIKDEREEYEQLKKTNDDLQKKIYLMDNNNRDFEKQSEQMLNEHKYLNTLANVHQVRFNLKETQDRYNKMASELQAKLNEKQSKCQEIEA